MSYNLIKTVKDLDSAISKISQAPILGIDIETTSLSPRNGKIRLLQINDGQQNHIIDIFAFDNILQIAERVKPILENEEIKKVIHSFNFEHKWLLSKMNVRTKSVFDSRIAFTLVDFPVGHKLNDASLRFFGINLDKTQQTSDWSGVLTQEQLDYAADDVEYLLPLRESLLKELIKSNQLEAMKLEMQVVPVVSEMELNGFCIDKQKYANVTDKSIEMMKKKGQELKLFLQTRGGKIQAPDKILQDSLFGGESVELGSDNDINIDSPSQVLKIYQEMGLPIESTAQKFIGAMLADYPDLKYLIDYREFSKLVTTYGQKVLDRIENNRIYCSFNQLGTVTSRFSSSDINLQQIPRTKAYRECFSASNGYKVTVCDFSQIELRILAEFSNDQVMLDAFKNKLDLHTLTCSTVFGIPYDDVQKGAKTTYLEQRTSSKTTNFSVAYGISPKMLVLRIKGEGIDCDEDRAKTLINGFYDTYKGAARWLFNRERIIEKDPNIRGMGGHLIKLVFDREDKKALGGAKRDSRNFLIQNLSAVITKVAIVNIHKNLIGKKAHICNVVHDEIVVECAEDISEEVKHLVEREMVRAGEIYLKKVPVIADGSIGTSWAEK